MSFPFPFRSDTFRYRTNVEPARVPVDTPVGRWGTHVFAPDGDYHADLELRRAILVSDPSRATVLAHMRPAAWDALVFVLSELALARPSDFGLETDGERWTWRNRLLDVDQPFVFGDEESLPVPPLEFAASQVQDDLVLLDQREGVLYADGGVVTFAADWSLAFVVGMTFLDLHAPVDAVVHREQVVTRAHDLLLHLEAGADIRRLNWSLTLGRHLDMSVERTPQWRADRGRLVGRDLGETLHLRVELQHLIRLPTTGAILFTIRTHHLRVDELAAVPEWRRRFTAVVRELPDELVRAKSMGTYRPALLAWLDEWAATA